MAKWFKKVLCFLIGHKDIELPGFFHMAGYGYSCDGELLCKRCRRIKTDYLISEFTEPVLILKRGQQLTDSIKEGKPLFEMHLR